jgi:hypothetical protein
MVIYTVKFGRITYIDNVSIILISILLLILDRTSNLDQITSILQKVFGISVKYCSICFYHTFVTTEYLETLLFKPKSKELPQEFCMELKKFPKETDAYNLSDPSQLKEVVRCLLTIINYMISGEACIGNY